MLRQDLARSAKKIELFFNTSKFRGLLNRFESTSAARDEGEGRFTPILSAYNEVATFFVRCTKEEREVLKIFKLDTMEDPKNWNAFIDSDRSSSTATTIYTWSSGLHFLLGYLPNLVAMLGEPDEMPPAELSENSERINFFLNESKDDLIELKVFTELLKTINELFDTISTLHKQKNIAFVWRIDSGSKKFFSILGNKSIVKEIKDAIIEIWNASR